MSTGEPVEITGCRVESAGIHIKAFGGTQLNIHHNHFAGLTPTGDHQRGRVLDDYRPRSLVFRNNTVDHTGGLLVDHADGRATRVVIRNNLFRNTDKRKADGTAGSHRAAVLFNTVLPVDAEIAWNEFRNAPGESFVEDNINLLNSGGTRARPILVHDNFIYGAYPVPLTSDAFSGSGITVEGDPTHHTFDDVSQHIKIYDNQVVSTCNAGINVNAGHDIDVQHNTIVSAGLYPDGSKGGFFWAGGAVWNGSKVSTDVFKDITYKNNTFGYVHEGMSKPFPNRQDVSEGVDLAQNVSLPNPITLETERREEDRWKKKVADRGEVIGNGDSERHAGEPD